MTEIEIPLPGLRLTATVHGPEQAPVLLALHGWLDNAASFHRLAEQLPQYRLIALDLPGHGHSAHLPTGPCVHYSLSDYVFVVLAAAGALELTHFDLLGHSLGAATACLLAAAAPERIRHLMLIEGLGPLADRGEQTLDRFRRAVTHRQTPRSAGLRSFPDIDSAVAARSQASGLDATLARAIVERGLVPIAAGYRWASDPRLTQPSPVRMAETQVQSLLGGIQCPAWLLLARPETPYLPAAMLRERAGCLPDIHIEHLDGGHHLHLQHPAAVASQIHAFLQQDRCSTTG